jgi:hypothetical protein
MQNSFKGVPNIGPALITLLTEVGINNIGQLKEPEAKKHIC